LIKSINKENKKVSIRIYRTFQEKSIKKEKIKKSKNPRKKARNDFEKLKNHPYPSRRSKAIYVKVHIFSPFVQYDFPSSFLNDPFKSL
jgi:hypothetical protein